MLKYGERDNMYSVKYTSYNEKGKPYEGESEKMRSELQGNDF